MSSESSMRSRMAHGHVALCGLLTLAAAAGMSVSLSGPHTPALLLWLPAPLTTLIGLSAMMSVARRADQSPAARRFWRHLAAGTLLALLGSVLNAYDTVVRGMPATYVSAVAGLGYGAAIVANLWGMARLPLLLNSRGEMLRAGLDGCVVVLAAGVFSWHYVTRPTLVGAASGATAAVYGVMFLALTLLSLVALGKVAMAGRGHLAPGVIPMLTLGMVAGAVFSTAQQFVMDKTWLASAQIAVPISMLGAALAARAQLRAAARPVTRRAAGRRLPVWMPYLAIAAVDALLIACIADGDADALPVAGVAVVLTALVVARQQTVFQDNANLVSRLDHSATHDSLTGLPNRALFNERLEQALADHSSGRPVSVALIDLDDFKTVNDTLGHGIGDALLVAIAERLSATLRKEDTVARLGGDEFVVVLDGIDPQAAEAAAHRMIAALAPPVTATGHELLVRASIGLADGHSGDDAADLLRRADIAMYAAKHGGGSNVERYTEGMAVTVADTAAVGAQLQHAIAGDQLFLMYQPIVALDSGRLRGVEALVRWAHPVQGVVPPVQFIPVAERTGLIVPLGDWVLREACRQLAAWREELGDRAPGVLNVNVSARQLRDAGFVDRVAAILAETGVAANRLTLEITESAAVELGEAVTRLDDLRRMGIRIALDDFGTGQSTLTLLHELPVDQLKLDRSFTQGTDTGRRDTMPAAVIALAQAVGLDLVAEGVETDDQATRLTGLGYRHAQGYHFARPLPAAAIAVMAAERQESIAA
ncbi:EAL domain-containing protein [Actinoplanes sp. NPDC023801]|uniref:putative bifunctional diguanylate cyclase/phosphodiesterase n=1 Tax=Actinoplanes sp. NPDC023801 TaxID=3154595 RepID=UPI00340886F0